VHGRKQGCYFRIGRPVDRVFICEGYATGATVRAETGSCVVVAMTAGNLTAVAQMVRAKLPDIEIVIAADNDAWTVVAGRPDNPGMRHATAAALAVSGRVVAPEFLANAQGKPTDWNDLFQVAGTGSVRDQIERQINKPQ
jgi:putative DNA primase/helicase